MISLQRLEGFYWVARTEGYARAARAFPYPITQPGVHQQVRRLESDLGLKLFERIGKDRVQLTASGRALYEHVAPFLEALSHLEQALRAGTFGGRLRIHAATMVVQQLLPGWLRKLQARRSDIDVELTEARRPDLAVLRSGEAELVVDHFPELPADVESRVVARAHSFLVLPTTHRLSQRSTVHLKDLQEETVVAYNPDLSGRELQLRALAQAGVRVQRLYSADSAESLLAFVAAGIGVSLVPSLAESGPRRAGIVAHRITLPGSTFPIVAAYRKARVANPLIEAALDVAPSPT
jgi:DNA-binding transcriptional LysR family regulator